MPPVVKSESRANSLLTLRALGWWWVGGGEGSGEDSDTLNAKVKGKSQPSEAGSGERLKKN